MDLLASEWIKARSVGSTWLAAGAAVVVTALVGLLGISGSVAGWRADVPADFDPAGVAFKGILVGQTLAVVVTVALLVPALAPGLPGALGQLAGTYWPTTAGQGSYTAAGSGPLPGAAGLGVLAVFTLWTTLAAHLALRTRDA